MIRIFIYLFPAAIDTVLALVFFVCTVQLADMGESAFRVSAILTIWAIVYMVVNLILTRVVTARNAAWLIMAGCLGSAGLAIGYTFSQTFVWGLYALMVGQGIATALFFAPFQVFMKQMDAGKAKSICSSTGWYTFSWSTGFALGPFVAGFLWPRIGWSGCHVLSGILAGAIAVAIYLLKHHGDEAHSAIANRQPPDASDLPGGVEGELPPVTDRSEEQTRPIDYSKMPDMAWAAWLFVGVAHVVITLIRGVLPSSGVACELTKPQLGLVFFLISAVQASMGLVLTRSRWWMYRPLPLLVFGVFGLIGLVLFSFAQTWGVFLLAAFCFGIYSGSFFFYFVFHSLVHPANSARYVSINEAVIGLTGAMGPILGGLVADHVGLNASYGVAVGLIVLVVVAQAIVHGRIWLRHRWASSP